MGSFGSKHDNPDPLTKDENESIDKLMDQKDVVLLDDLLHKWNLYLTHNMSNHIKQLFASNKASSGHLIHAYQCLSTNEMYQESYQELIEIVISKSNVEQYMLDLLETVILCLKDTNEYARWIEIGAKPLAIHQLASYLSKKELSGDFNLWLQSNTLIGILHKALITTLYGIPQKLNLLPAITIHEKYKHSFKTILDLGWIMFLKNKLPIECQENWRLLFSSRSHGESFQALSTAIIDQGNTVLIVRDSLGNVFGGYSSEPWSLKPKYYGDSSCFLFSLHPTLNVYVASEQNDHYMYMNNGQHTLPNGIGMGGQMDFWGLWIDSEYGIGQSNISCSTYSNYSMLSAEKDFTIDCLEVWCVKEKPIEDDEEGERKLPSNQDSWDVKLLEMAGRPKFSEGYREEEGY